MDMCKLRGTFLRVYYSALRLIAAIEDVLEADQAVGRVRELIDFQSSFVVSEQINRCG
jgi:hypothetical protein